jgi:hypothetical protein
VEIQHYKIYTTKLKKTFRIKKNHYFIEMVKKIGRQDTESSGIKKIEQTEPRDFQQKNK